METIQFITQVLMVSLIAIIIYLLYNKLLNKWRNKKPNANFATVDGIEFDAENNIYLNFSVFEKEHVKLSLIKKDKSQLVLFDKNLEVGFYKYKVLSANQTDIESPVFAKLETKNQHTERKLR